MFQFLEATPDIYQGHFGEFQITKQDRLGVVIYRGALAIAALSFAVGAFSILVWGAQPFCFTKSHRISILFLYRFWGESLYDPHLYDLSSPYLASAMGSWLRCGALAQSHQPRVLSIGCLQPSCEFNGGGLDLCRPHGPIYQRSVLL